MYKVNKETKKLEKVSETSFSDIKCKERSDLQEWIVSNPAILGEELLIIQKEFADFDNTNERLDLLAIDKSGKIVVIENKTDDTGRDVVWQAVKYASYCSTLSAAQVKDIFAKYISRYCLDIDAEQEILDFLGKDSFDSVEINPENSQRIILVSHKFRPEVLSAAQWLLNYGVGISCIQVTPLKYGNDVFLDSDQILPQPEMQEFTLKLANKAKDDQMQKRSKERAEELRNKFWKLLLPAFQEKSSLFDGVSPDKYDHWISAGSGVSGCPYSFIITKNYCGVELGLSTYSQENNKKMFDKLFQNKSEIEDLFGAPLNWERLDDKKMSRISVSNTDLSLINEDNWEQIKEYLIETMIRFEKALSKYVQKLKKTK